MSVKVKEELAKNETDGRPNGKLSRGLNRLERKRMISHHELNIEVGDICYIDFGQAYINEAGFQHFGLVGDVQL